MAIKDFWVISATHNIAHVKPAKEGAVDEPESGHGERVGLLVSADREERPQPDLKVYVNCRPERADRQAQVLQRRASRIACRPS